MEKLYRGGVFVVGGWRLGLGLGFDVFISIRTQIALLGVGHRSLAIPYIAVALEILQ